MVSFRELRSSWLGNPQVCMVDVEHEFGRMIASAQGKGRYGRYWLGSPTQHYSRFLVMDVFEQGVKVSFPSWSYLGRVSDAFRWTDMRSLYMSPDTVGWRDADGWKWMFTAYHDTDLNVFFDAVRKSETPYEWRAVVGLLESYLP